MKFKMLLVTAIFAAAISGCASSPKDIKTSSVSPLLYKDSSCDQLYAEGDRTSRKVNELYTSIEGRATSDAVATGVGLVLFWPALFFIKGDSPESAEYARLKGEYDAVEKTAIQKNCNMALMPKPINPEIGESSNTKTATDVKQM